MDIYTRLVYVVSFPLFSTAADFTCTDGQIRLADGDGENQGRVEICFDNQYGTICDYQWDNSDAAVVCGQLGFSRECTYIHRALKCNSQSGKQIKQEF